MKTLESTPDDRRCFRMIGGVLVEKNVGETKPVLQLKVSKISETIVLLNKELHSLLDEFEKWKVSLISLFVYLLYLFVTNTARPTIKLKSSEIK